MNKNMKVVLNYCGYYKKTTGKQSEEFEIYLNSPAEHISRHLKSNYDIDPPFIILLNGKNLIRILKDGYELKEGDELNILPHISGG